MEVVPWEACGLENSGAVSLHDACLTDCVNADDERGTRYSVLIDGEFSNWICVVPGQDADMTPDRVLRAFQRLEWPTSELIVQPPDGRTLVNFETNFLTENTESVRQQVTLLGQDITIEAWPESYTWEFGDGESRTTESAGARYPELEVTHRYLQKDSYAPSVATTYAGRYRVGTGPWVDIPGTHTVEGESVGLEVIEARPVLVAPDGE